MYVVCIHYITTGGGRCGQAGQNNPFWVPLWPLNLGHPVLRPPMALLAPYLTHLMGPGPLGVTQWDLSG